MLFGFIFLDSDEDPLPPKIRYMHAISILLCTLLYICNNIVLVLQGGAKVLSYN